MVATRRSASAGPSSCAVSKRPAASHVAAPTAPPLAHTPSTHDFELAFGLRSQPTEPNLWDSVDISAMQRDFDQRMDEAHLEHISVHSEHLVEDCTEPTTEDSHLISRLLSQARRVGDAMSPPPPPPLHSTPVSLDPSYDKIRDWHRGNRYLPCHCRLPSSMLHP